MSEDNENALQMALRAVISVAVHQGYDAELLCEDAIDALRNDGAYEAEDRAVAAEAIEAAIDELLNPVR